MKVQREAIKKTLRHTKTDSNCRPQVGNSDCLAVDDGWYCALAGRPDASVARGGSKQAGGSKCSWGILGPPKTVCLWFVGGCMRRQLRKAVRVSRERTVSMWREWRG